MTDEPRNLSSDCITRAKVTMLAPSPYSPLSSSDSRRRRATSSRRPVQSLGGRRCGFSNDRKVSVPSSGSPGVVYLGVGTGEVVREGIIATASRVGARVIGGAHGKDQGTTPLVPKYQQKVHELNIQFASLDQPLSLQLSLRAGAQHDTDQYKELSWKYSNTRT